MNPSMSIIASQVLGIALEPSAVNAAADELAQRRARGLRRDKEDCHAKVRNRARDPWSRKPVPS